MTSNGTWWFVAYNEKRLGSRRSARQGCGVKRVKNGANVENADCDSWRTMINFDVRKEKNRPRERGVRRHQPMHHFYLWNQLPSLFRQPHSVHCPPGSPHPAHITSSQSPPSLSPASYITPSIFHSRLKTHLFHKPFRPRSFLFLPNCLHGPWTWIKWAIHWRLFCFSFFF